MFFKLFNKKKKHNVSEEVPSYKNKILEQMEKNKLKEVKRIKQLIDRRLKHMIKDGCACSSLNLSLDYIDIYSLNIYLKELEKLKEYKGIYLKIYEYVNETMIEIGIKDED